MGQHARFLEHFSKRMNPPRPLDSPAFEFADQGSAVAAAQAIMAELFVETPGCAAEQVEAARIAGRSAMQVPINRRAFLQGMLGGRKS